MQIYPYDSYHNNLNLLTKNVINLSNIQLNHFNYQKLYMENEKLHKENNNYVNEISSLKKKLKTNTNTNTNINTNISIISYYPTPYSWTNDKINETLTNIKTIEDIIKLDKLWIYIKHNTLLQRLYYLIPALIKLNNMVGLTKIKDDVFKKIIYHIQNPTNTDYLHTVITGSPGVGKTEFAKIYADIFVKLRILKSNTFIEIKRDDLVGEYLGHTSIKTKQLLESGMNGVIFLDEAYSLGNPEKRDSFSKEAIDMINQYLSERKNDFMFIIAGYDEELENCLFAYNKGMKRRFHTYYYIEGYKPPELKEIFIRKINNSNYKLTVTDENINNFFKNDFPFYGGDIEKLVNEIKQVHALRTFNNNINNKDIIMNDMVKAYNNLFPKKVKTYIHNSMYI
jgi:AAA+ superfamily predicted ATPase